MIDLKQLETTWTREKPLLQRLDLANLPRHVAIIMDGNGRWAQGHSLPRVEGHRAGVKAVRETVETCAALEMEVLTLYAFSVENWKRPKHEIWMLMNLLKEFLRNELDTLMRNDIRLNILGRWHDFEPSVVREINRGLEATKDCPGMCLNIGLNYSGRCEIVDACRRIVSDWANGKGTDINEETMGKYLYTSGQPDPDLLIRTSGEFRVSNFLLWQIAYSEIWVTETLWPDFDRGELLKGLLEYQARDRRYGGVKRGATTESDSNPESSSKSSQLS
ncbi:MAG: isoprenyl transferase [Thermoanaerobaculia bacterium]